MNNTSIISKINFSLFLFFSFVLFFGNVHGKDNINFNCSAAGSGFQTPDKSGPWRFELGSFQWRYNADMVKPKPDLKNKKSGCIPVDIESPKIFLDKGKYIYITAHRCGDEKPSYFYSTTVLNDIEINHQLGYVDDIIKDKYVRVVLESAKEDKLKLKDKIFHFVYFDCTASK